MPALTVHGLVTAKRLTLLETAEGRLLRSTVEEPLERIAARLDDIDYLSMLRLSVG